MGRTATGKPNGRPSLLMNWTQIDSFLEAGCSGVTISSALGCHPNTLYERCAVEKGMGFCDYFRQKKAKGNALIRIRQFEIALAGDRAMLIWLGKQRLGQTNSGPRKNSSYFYRIKVVHFRQKINTLPDTTEAQIF